MKNEKEIRYIDLFGGVGGFRLGIQGDWSSRPKCRGSQKSILSRRNSPSCKAPWNYYKPKCVFYCDNDKYAVQTYNKNFGENWKATDIRTIEADSIPDFDWLCGGFPCQAFSIAGKRRGFQDTRGTLFFEIARIIKSKRPKIIFLENVKGLLNHNKGQTFSIILQTLSELGYDVQWMVLNSKFFGVPQNRERVFIIGSLRKTSRPEILPFRESSTKIDKTQKQISSTIHSGYYKMGGRDQQYVVRQIKVRKEIDNHGRITEKQDGTIFTLSGSGRNSGRNQVIISKKRRLCRLTPTECERLQGFPDNWIEGVSDTQRYKQMGNAVTVNVIQAIAEKLLNQNNEEVKK